MGTNGLWKHSDDVFLWSASNNHLESLQVVDQSPALERTQESLEILRAR